MAKRSKICFDVRANLISTKVSTIHSNSTQVHASPRQTESQVAPSFQLASTCDFVCPGLNKAPGFDKVSMSVIKDALPCILPVLTDIVNRSLFSSVFPAAWKISEVIPLAKGGDHEIPTNIRPVSLLPAASKICERVVLNQLMTYMTTKKRLSEHQNGKKKLYLGLTLNVMITGKAPEAIDAKKGHTRGTSGLVESIRQHRSCNPPCKTTGAGCVPCISGLVQELTF